MTIQEAVVILNERRHRGHPNWRINHDNEIMPDEADEYESLTDFEAIAVAEKYVRDSARDAEMRVAPIPGETVEEFARRLDELFGAET